MSVPTLHRDDEDGGLAAAWDRAPARELRLRVWQAVEQSVPAAEASTHRRRIRTIHAAAEPIAENLIQLLEARATPHSDLDYSLLSGVQAMTAFGCLVTDHAYSRAAASTVYKADVARCMSIFVVASALYDHLCDREADLLPLLHGAVGRDWPRAAFAGEAPGDPLAGASVPPIVAYLGVLGGEAASIWSRMIADSRAPAQPLWQLLTATYRAQRASAPSLVEGPVTRDAATIWSAPFCIALHIVASTSDAMPALSVRALLPEARRMGLLLSFVDDLADVADDWRYGSANQFLERAGIDRGGSREAPVPWQRLLSDEVLEPYLDEIVGLVETFSYGEREVLLTWLLYWLGSG